MSLEVLKAVISLLGGSAAMLHFTAWTWRMFVIRGSHARYITSTIMVGCAALTTISAFIGGIISAVQGDYLDVGIKVVLTVIWAWITKKAYNDDNWFNDQWKRLKRGVKRLRRRIAALLPTPLPSPA